MIFDCSNKPVGNSVEPQDPPHFLLQQAIFGASLTGGNWHCCVMQQQMSTWLQRPSGPEKSVVDAEERIHNSLDSAAIKGSEKGPQPQPWQQQYTSHFVSLRTLALLNLPSWSAPD